VSYRERGNLIRVSEDTGVSEKIQITSERLELTGEPPQKFALIHAVFEGLAAIDEYDWDLIVELPAQFGVAIDVHFLPGKSAAARELGETFFYHFAKVAAFARVNHNLSEKLHDWILSFSTAKIPPGNCEEMQKAR
jgi:hypothetical protein